MTDLSPAQKAAQDDARRKGKFGEQNHGDPGTDLISDSPAKVLHTANPQATIEECLQAYYESGKDPVKAQVWLNRQQYLKSDVEAAKKHLETVDMARKQAAQFSVRACLQRIHQFYPNTTRVVLRNYQDSDDDLVWMVETPDCELDYVDDNDLIHELAVLTSVDSRHPLDIVSCCTGYVNAKGKEAEGLLTRERDGHLITAEFNLYMYGPEWVQKRSSR